MVKVSNILFHFLDCCLGVLTGHVYILLIVLLCQHITQEVKKKAMDAQSVKNCCSYKTNEDIKFMVQFNNSIGNI
jgi:hypothetical protein